jgi:hypothetical protein
MSRLRVAAAQVMPVPPDKIYAILADYRTAHPQILPKANFRHLVIEAGGHGAVTVFRIQTGGNGVWQDLHMVVTEPEQGQVLMERDTASDLTTTFTIRPTGADGQTRVEIATEWTPRSGLGGLVERLLYPRLMPGIYHKELQQLARMAQETR